MRSSATRSPTPRGCTCSPAPPPEAARRKRVPPAEQVVPSQADGLACPPVVPPAVTAGVTTARPRDAAMKPSLNATLERTRTMTTVPTTNAPDFAAIKTRQQAAWASGDYAVVGTTLQIVGESLCEALDLAAGSHVIDIAAGNGNATLAAARRFCTVVSTDYVSTLLDKGRERAAAERLAVDFRVADAEALPFADAEFDVAISVFGTMFTPEHARAAAEMARVVRPGGKIGVASWTPDSFIGQVFK